MAAIVGRASRQALLKAQTGAVVSNVSNLLFKDVAGTYLNHAFEKEMLISDLKPD